MASQELKRQAIHITSDLEDFCDSYNIDEIEDEDELKQYIIELGDLKLNFRRICHQLKSAEGDDFATKYPDFDEDLILLIEKFKKANEKLSVIKKKKLENDAFGIQLLEKEQQVQEEREKQEKIKKSMGLHSESPF